VGTGSPFAQNERAEHDDPDDKRGGDAHDQGPL
jgi:hypothetical protein